ncbi:alkaline-phosphatase-like protein [Syncephalastrum racemosum]|uniref:GPI ethanolamine phosphate transferase 2 n=1 Tax=Syncephalastrum racemosum TaxID=13706 RepID=A0A1X2HND2_SYNRA|nr:alkaline-phosphatase-like protein [Syncephalastrum racemosum]
MFARAPQWLFGLVIIQLIGLALFCRGFFPYKVYLPGFATEEGLPPWPDSNQPGLPPIIEPEFDRLVLIVIDALRNDFILGDDSGFDFVRAQIERGSALPFTAKATAPTVTMPRIKAMTTGTVPSFLDAVLNIAEADTSSSLEYQDNWVYQFKAYNKTLHFFGDDTWIRLLPDIFTKHDGTTSFYVSDTVEVDKNVTRHIYPVFEEQDWDAVILHYLGLDHVGHLGGPDSPLMRPKQIEMDHAIESIYTIVAKQDAQRLETEPTSKGTLLVVCGDHGMNDLGNHGGSSEGETSPALVFLSPRFETRPILKKPRHKLFSVDDREKAFGFPVVDQTDLVPTLAALFSVPIPKNSLGKIIPDLFLRLSSDARNVLRAFQLNAHQMSILLRKTGSLNASNMPASIENQFEVDGSDNSLLGHAESLHAAYARSPSDEMAAKTAAGYLKFLSLAQAELGKKASDYGLTDMMVGLTLLVLCAVAILWYLFQCTFSRHWHTSKILVCISVGTYAASMFASSFIEEERLIWFFYSQTLFALLLAKCFCRHDALQGSYSPYFGSILQLVLLRITFSWNQGDGLYSTLVNWMPGIEWHMLALALLTHVMLAAYKVRTLGRGNPAHTQVGSNAGAIQWLCRGGLVSLLGFQAVLVLLYKLREAFPADAPGPIYSYYLDLLAGMDIVAGLDQVELARLIYNYAGATLFALGALRFVNLRAEGLDIVGDDSYIHEQQEEESNPRQIHQQQQCAPATNLYVELLLYILTPLMILFSRTHNAALFIVYAIQWHYLRAMPPWTMAFVITCLSQTAFFTTGHSNSIATVDLSNAYIGVTGYNTLLIGALTYFSNWAGSIWWAVAGWTWSAKSVAAWREYIVTQSAIYGVFLATLSISVTMLREHLFVWTVFSPKYLYQMSWTLLYHWCTQTLVGALIIIFLSDI